MVRKETGEDVDRRMVVAVPDWDVFNKPKERLRSNKKKPVLFEEAMVEEDAENANKEQCEDAENDSVDEMVDNAENTIAAEETVEVSKNQEVRAEVTAAQEDIATSERQENRAAEVVKDTHVEK
ncbi:hypothetical protein P8452_68201 [Trifolium repens]|nr:hypothetical protein P8452_68201 [Trifolium repens]